MTPTCYTTKEELALMERQGMGLMYDRLRGDDCIALYSEGRVKEMIQIAYDEVPRVPLLQPTMDVAMRREIQGYMYWFHLQPDYRQLSKS